MVSGRTVVNAIAGAVIAIVLSALPLSTLLGGAVAGFLEGADRSAGATVGALAGLIVFLPFVGLALLLLGFLGLVVVPGEGVVFLLILFGLAGSIVFVYTVVLGLLGGYLGAVLADEYPRQHAKARGAIGVESSPHRDRDLARGSDPERVGEVDADRDDRREG